MVSQISETCRYFGSCHVLCSCCRQGVRLCWSDVCWRILTYADVCCRKLRICDIRRTVAGRANTSACVGHRHASHDSNAIQGAGGTYISIHTHTHTHTHTHAHTHTSYASSLRPPTTSAYVSIRQRTCPYFTCSNQRQHTSAYVSIRQHTSAYVSIRVLTYLQQY